MYRLYDYYRSSAAYRVRIALNLKGLDFESVPVDLRAGEQAGTGHRLRQPQGLVPVLETPEGDLLNQSLAICEYLDEVHSTPSLLPGDTRGRARVRALAQLVACDIHPLDNLRVLRYLTGTLGVTEADKRHWYHHWLILGFQALETRLREPDTGDFCHGDQVTLADLCLVPQIYNARRFECDLSPFPVLQRISARCEAMAAFVAAHPDSVGQQGER